MKCPRQLPLPLSTLPVPAATGWGTEPARVSPLASARFAVTADGRVFSLHGRWRRYGVGFPDKRTAWVVAPPERKLVRRGGNGRGKVGYYRSVSYWGQEERGKKHAVSVYVHDLVASAWIGAKTAGMEVDHCNSVEWDNRVENLRYVEAEENKRRRRGRNVRT